MCVCVCVCVYVCQLTFTISKLLLNMFCQMNSNS